MTDDPRPTDGRDRADERDRAGEAVRRRVLGDDHVDRARATATSFTAPFHGYVTRAAWGEVWARPGLDLRTRSCLTLAILAALRCEQELAMHVAAAVRLGVTAEEIREVLLHATVYAGAPAGNAAFAVAARVLAELGVELPDPDRPDLGVAP
jgi:4-carboxymuconolactone decarboxylase